MNYLLTTVLALCLVGVFSAVEIELNNVQQNCDGDMFTCQYNNPCRPLCADGQHKYPGNWPNKFIKCLGFRHRRCVEENCPRKHYYNKHTQKCEIAKQDCAADKFTCDYNNPCKPLCAGDQLLYPGNWPNKYIECSGDNNGVCSEKTCPPQHYWNKHTESCKPKKQDCSDDKFSCDYNNPCKPLCDSEVTSYPGNWPNKYITCTGDNLGICTEETCPAKHYFNKHLQRCEERRQDCGADRFTCDYNNPCKPICDREQLRYPGDWGNKYVQCSGANLGVCEEHTCPNKHYFNEHTQACEPRRQDCSAEKFSCDYNSPCKDLCVEGQLLYPGNWPNAYVECSGENKGVCREKNCAPNHYFNKHVQKCLMKTQDCNSNKFTCDYNNPCKPLCDSHQLLYPGNWPNKFIECSGENLGVCTELTCAPNEHFNAETLRCEPKTIVGIQQAEKEVEEVVEQEVQAVNEVENVQKQKCGNDKFTCQYNDPCDPLCVAGQHKYPGNWPNKYVQCVGLLHKRCTEKTCPNKHYYNMHTQTCEEVSQDCRSEVFSCDYNNPCKPLCDENNLRYIANWPNKYVQCSGEHNGVCNEEDCPKGQIFSYHIQGCRDERQDCASDKFHCNYNNPCKPLCSEGVFRYPGNWNNNYIECSGENSGVCKEITCDRKFVYNPVTQECEPKPECVGDEC